LSGERLKAMMRLACAQGCSRLGIDKTSAAYAARTMDTLLPHIQTALRCGHPETIFIVPKETVFA